MTNHFKVFAIVLGLCFALISSNIAFSQESDGPPSQQEANRESKACKTALKACKTSLGAFSASLAGQWAACQPLRVCKNECRYVKKECKQDARSTKKQCVDQCKSEFRSGKKFRDCKKLCKGDKKEAKQDCRNEKRVCKNICRADFASTECKAAGAATGTTGGAAALSCLAITQCIGNSEKRAEEQ